MALLSLNQICLGYGGPYLLDHVDFHLDKGERVCLIGRNGTGKSTLMKLIAGELQAESGSITAPQGLRVTRLEQEVPASTQGSISDVVAGGLGNVGPAVAQYHQALKRLETDSSPKALEALEKAQAALEALDGWSVEQRIEVVLNRLSLDPDMTFSDLSGGMKRRVLLARALVSDPDILLLDEPTNHLDIHSITWLESFLKSYEGTVLFVTHDRVFLQALATRIVELDRGLLTSYPGNFQTYLERKEAALESEAQSNAEFDKRLAKEEAWLRRGVKARRARNEGRVRALKELRAERSARRSRMGQVNMTLQEGSKSGKMVLETRSVSKRYDGQDLFKDFTTTIHRGDRVGIIGPNGCGKSTLLKVLLGQLEPDSGSVRIGTSLDIAYFDQMRSLLDEEKSVSENVSPGSETVEINGNKKHIIGYLQDFLFSPERARTPVKALSGGERNRLLLARLFTRPANLLVMDEPTNDLDAETLELLEERLLAYQGTLLLVSHDRAFLDNVVTSCIVFDEGEVREYVGGYEDWVRQRAVEKQTPKTEPAKSAPPRKLEPVRAKPKSKKLSNKEKQLLDQLPAQIEKLESEQERIQALLLEPGFYQKPSEVVTQVQQELTEAVAKTEAAYKKWEELDARS